MGKRVRNTKGNSQGVETLLGNRIPPHSAEAEMAILGSMLLDNSTIPRALELVSKETFFLERNKLIFSAIVDMFQKSMQVDLITLSEELTKLGHLESVGGVEYLASLLDSVPTAQNIELYCKIAQEKYIKRALLETAGSILFECYDDTIDALEQVDKAERSIFQIAEKRFARNYVSINKLAHEAIEVISRQYELGKRGLTGLPTGFIDLDQKLGGLQKSDLIVIAARPSVGKTALALSMARNIAVEYRQPVAFFSLEMSAQQLTFRLLSAQTGVSNHKIRTGNLSQKEIKFIIDRITPLATAPILIDDSPNISLIELRAKCRRLKSEHNISAVFIDYLQLIDPPKAESREREISIISRTLKQIAKELDIPVVALSQLNRSVENRADKKPQLSDLRESGSIEQDADVVLFIYRPEVYGLTKWPDKSQLPVEGVAEIIIGKQRNGPTGSIKLVYLKDLLRFDNAEFSYLKEETELPADDDLDEDLDIDEEDFGDDIDDYDF